VLSGGLRQGGNPVLRWMPGNPSIETDAADNWKPSNKKGIERIDGIVALITALERASRHDELKGVYELWEPLFITADGSWGDSRDN
jgi:phage terminase large subunit-like protein